MLRILFDKNVPYSLRRHLIDYHVQTADDEGWEQVSPVKREIKGKSRGEAP